MSKSVNIPYSGLESPSLEDVERARQHDHIKPWDESKQMVAVSTGNHRRQIYHTCWTVDEDGEINLACENAFRSGGRLAPKVSVSTNRTLCENCEENAN